MTSRRFKLASIPRWVSITAVLVILVPNTVFATHFELSRLANQIELISGQFADDLRYTRHYGSVRQRAVTLRREAAQLADSLRRNRSNSRIRSRFKDVRRGYERLEQAFFSADRRDHVPRLFRELNLLSNVFSSLIDEFYYAGLGGQNYGPVYNAPNSGISIIGSRNYGSRNYGSRNYGSRRYGSRDYNSRNSGSRDMGSRRGSSRDHDRRDRGSRSTGLIVPSRERAIPPVFRGDAGGGVSNRQGDRQGRAERGGRGASDRNHPDGGSGSVQRAPSLGHSSRVLERQSRQDATRRELEGQGRRNRPSASARQSPGVNGERRGSRGRGAVTESRRRNH